MRFQAALLLSGVLWILVVLAMASHDRLDPAFTTSGQHTVPHNWVGQLGAYVSDILQMSEASVQPTPDVASDQVKTFVKGIFSIDGRMISLIELDYILPQVEAEAA